MNVKEAIQIIARENKVTPQEVEKQMQYAIQEVMKNQDPRVQQLWKQVAPDGKEPSINEFIEYCVIPTSRNSAASLIGVMKRNKTDPEACAPGSGVCGTLIALLQGKQ